MAIDLLKLAKEVSETYRDVECTFGTIRVYHVPDVVVWSYTLDEPEPKQPNVKMKLAGGSVQYRPIKQGDKGFDEWQEKELAYEKEATDFRLIARLVEALRDEKYPDISSPPPMAVARLNGHWPENEILRKGTWLDYSVLAAAGDKDKIISAVAEMSGLNTPDEEMVDEVKKS